jgi:hypothetical protein
VYDGDGDGNVDGEGAYEVEAVLDRRFNAASMSPGCCCLTLDKTDNSHTPSTSTSTLIQTPVSTSSTPTHTSMSTTAPTSSVSYTLLPEDERDEGCSGYEYLIRWRGYGPEFDTWEPSINLACPAQIKLYHQVKTNTTQ